MAYSRPRCNSKHGINTPWKSGGGVQKRRKDVKEDGRLGRGRKNTWNLPWLKKLVVLRLCGLHFSEIFEILSILSQNTTPSVKRTAQHRMQSLFGKEWKVLCASDKDTTKRRLQFLLATEHSRKKRRDRVPCKNSSLDHEGQPQGTKTPEANPQKERHHHSQSLLDFEALFKLANGDAPPLGPGDSFGCYLSTSKDRNDQIDAASVISTASTFSKISDILKDYGRSVSERSLIKHALSLRYSLSLSSLATSLNQSLSETSSNFHGITDISVRAHAAQDNHDVTGLRPQPISPLILEQQETMRADNRALFDQCCSQDPDCIHQRIAHCTINPKDQFSIPYWSLRDGRDSAGRTELFFAAGVGSPLHVFLELINYLSTSINVWDKEGRTFLFYLDPRGVVNMDCGCQLGHESALACLFGRLNVAGFNFYHVDHEGRTFLDFFCLYEHFEPEHLLHLLGSNTEGQTERNTNIGGIIKELALSRDSFGLSFVDRLSSPHLERFFLSPLVYKTIPMFSSFRNGRTQVHNLLLARCKDAQQNKDEEVLRLIRTFYEQGANLDRQSSCGTTPLIFAAKNSYPNTVHFLLSVVGSSATTTDSSGRSAQDYTMENFNASRKSKAWAPSLVNPLKTLIHMADNKVEFRSPNISSKRLAGPSRLWQRGKDRSIREITDYSIFDHQPASVAADKDTSLPADSQERHSRLTYLHQLQESSRDHAFQSTPRAPV